AAARPGGPGGGRRTRVGPLPADPASAAALAHSDGPAAGVIVRGGVGAMPSGRSGLGARAFEDPVAHHAAELAAAVLAGAQAADAAPLDQFGDGAFDRLAGGALADVVEQHP